MYIISEINHLYIKYRSHLGPRHEASVGSYILKCALTENCIIIDIYITICNLYTKEGIEVKIQKCNKVQGASKINSNKLSSTEPKLRLHIITRIEDNTLTCL